ncbi:hypothetical protein PIB30_010217 [Stylosanthes scabra]|uniref:Uncharacterized protein n=1 Tax=Stylosanthes scabra TaxID=79078 RepID=A0ABU6S5S0_9FABA|nr:hypothetical protein [Stylosanthes scabra]
MGRAPCCDKNGLKKGPWTPEEDQKLVDYIQKHGYGNWRTLPKNAGLQRCGKSCRLRWTNYLRPDIKRGRFSFEEEETIIQLHSILGNKWSAIASRLPGRTDNEIKNYWNTHIRKRLLRMGIDPVTHTPRLDLLDLSSILIHHHHNNSSSLSSPINSMLNPQLLKLASSIISSHNENLEFTTTTYHHHHDPQIQNQNPTPPQQQHFVQIQEAVNNTSSCVSLPPLIEPNNNNMNTYPLNNLSDHNWDTNGIALTEEDYVPQLSSYDYYSSDNHHLMDPSLLSEASTTFHSNSNNNLSFAASVMSTPSSSSPTTLNNNSNSTTTTTHINGSSSTEDESDSMLRFEIPDVLDVTQFCDNHNVIVSDYYY